MRTYIKEIENARRNVVRTKTNLEIARTMAEDDQIQEMSYYLALAKYFGIAAEFFRTIANKRSLSEKEKDVIRILKFDHQHFRKSKDGKQLIDFDLDNLFE